MQDRAILAALAELDRWKRRQVELEGEREGEREKIARQVAYYEALVRDMKKEVRPARLSDLLKAMTLLR